MKFEIRNRWSGEVQITAEIECEESASINIKLGLAVKWAVKSWAYLSGADLSRADLSGADLSRADLSRANLSWAYGIAPEICTPLLMLLDQPGPLRAYKLVNEVGVGPFNGGIKYEIGKTVEEPTANADPSKDCAAGINVATLDWCLKEWKPGYRILIVEFDVKDIACIPTATAGKFRLRRCKVIAEKTFDPVKLGLMKAETVKAA